MLDHNACKHPYTESPKECTERFTYQYEQDPEALLQAAWRAQEESAKNQHFADLLAGMLGQQPAQRITFESMLEHGGTPHGCKWRLRSLTFLLTIAG